MQLRTHHPHIDWPVRLVLIAVLAALGALGGAMYGYYAADLDQRSLPPMTDDGRVIMSVPVSEPANGGDPRAR